MARLLTANDLAGLPEDREVRIFRVSDNYTGARYCSDYPQAIVAARDEDEAIALYCEFADVSDWHFYHTSCDCCASVDIGIYSDRVEVSDLLAELREGATAICRG